MAWLLFSFGPPLLLYSAQIWIEVPAALLLAVALDRLASLSKLGQARPRDLLVFGLALALMPLLKIRLLLLVFPLLLLAAWRGRLGGRRTAQLAAGLGVVVLALFLYNKFSFGNPFKMYGRGDFQPSGYVFFASSSDTDPAMITSSPCFQFAGVATLCLAVS